MDTGGKSNAEFRSDVNETLNRHESNINQIHQTLQTLLTEMQSIRANQEAQQNQIQTITQSLENTNPFTTTKPPTAPPHKPIINNINSTGPSFTTTQNNHHLKLSFPKFNGEDAQGWVYKAEQYFEFKEVAADQQVQLASFHLEGVALQWHRWLFKFKGPLTWEEFTQAVLQRFGLTDYEDPSEALTRLKQTTTVAAYQEEFEKLSHRVDDLPKNFLVGCFIAGLKDEVRLDVKIKQPRTLATAIGVARLIEERNSLLESEIYHCGQG